MTIDIDMPDQIDDETAAWIVDFLYALGDAVGARYDGQIRRQYQCRRQYPPPLDDGEQLTLFPEIDSPSEPRAGVRVAPEQIATPPPVPSNA